jgi:hypothetical protein
MAMLATLARHDRRDADVVQQTTRFSVGRFASLVFAAETDADRRAGATLAQADLLLSVLARPRGPGFGLPRFVDDQFDDWYARRGATDFGDAMPVVDTSAPSRVQGIDGRSVGVADDPPDQSGADGRRIGPLVMGLQNGDHCACGREFERPSALPRARRIVAPSAEAPGRKRSSPRILNLRNARS